MGFKGFHISKEKQESLVPFLHDGQEYELAHGSVVIAAVISCTNNCNPSVMLTAGERHWRNTVLYSQAFLKSQLDCQEFCQCTWYRLLIDRFAGQESSGGGPYRQALHPHQPGSWQWHGHPLPQHQWSTALPQPARVRTRTDRI